MARRTRHRHPSASASVSARPSAAMAAHDAASGTDLAMRDWNPVAGSADADLLPDLDTLTARSRACASAQARVDGWLKGRVGQ